MKFIVAIAIIIILNAAYVFVQRNDAKVLAEENKRLYVQIKSVGVIHEYEVDGETVKIIKE